MRFINEHNANLGKIVGLGNEVKISLPTLLEACKQNFGEIELSDDEILNKSYEAAKPLREELASKRRKLYQRHSKRSIYTQSETGSTRESLIPSLSPHS